MRDQEIVDLQEAYASIYASQEEVVEEVEEIEEASYSAKAARAGKDIGKPGKAFAKIAKEAGERYGSKERGEKVAGAVLAKLRKEEYDLFDTILEHLVAEGYADTNEAALVIMANMSEEWRQSILDEGYKDLPRKKMYNKMINVRMHGRGEGYTPATRKMMKVADEHKPEESQRKERENRERGGRG